jgi:hypothetical protein
MGFAFLAAVVILSIIAGANPMYTMFFIVGRTVWTIFGDQPFLQRLGKHLVKLGWGFIFAMTIYVGAEKIIGSTP